MDKTTINWERELVAGAGPCPPGLKEAGEITVELRFDPVPRCEVCGEPADWLVNWSPPPGPVDGKWLSQAMAGSVYLCAAHHESSPEADPPAIVE